MADVLLFAFLILYFVGGAALLLYNWRKRKKNKKPNLRLVKDD